MNAIRVQAPTIVIGLLAIEFCLFIGSFYVGAAFSWIDFSGSANQLAWFMPRAMLYAGSLSVCMYALGLYRRDCLFHGSVVLPRALVAFLCALIIYAMSWYSLHFGIWRAVLGYAMPLSLVCVIGLRSVAREFLDQDTFKRGVAVIGTSKRAARLEALEASPYSGFKIVGFIKANQGEEVRVSQERLIKPGNSFLDLLRDHAVDSLVITTNTREEVPDRQLVESRLAGVRIFDYETFHALESGRVDLDHLEPDWFLVESGFHGAISYRLFKRVVDCLLSSALFVLTLPLLALAALAIWLEDRGPVIYRQRRVGLRGEVFSLFKLRSMNIAAEDDGLPQWSTKQDGRVTRVGRIIRRLRVDEIPQLINILRGEMSFVGPRPERPYFVERLAQENSFYLDRHSVKPGLTGWAQVNFAYGSSAGDARRKLEYDLFYIKYGDVLLDIVVILQTVRVVLWPQSVERSEWA